MPAVFAIVSPVRILGRIRGDAVDERTEVEAAGRIDEVNARGRREGILAVLRGVIVGGQPAGEQHRGVEGRQAPDGEAKLHGVRILGSSR